MTAPSNEHGRAEIDAIIGKSVYASVLFLGRGNEYSFSQSEMRWTNDGRTAVAGVNEHRGVYVAAGPIAGPRRTRRTSLPPHYWHDEFDCE